MVVIPSPGSYPAVLVLNGSHGHGFASVPHDLFDVHLHHLVLLNLNELFFNDDLFTSIGSFLLQYQHTEHHGGQPRFASNAVLDLDNSDSHLELSDSIMMNFVAVHVDLTRIQVKSNLGHQF